MRAFYYDAVRQPANGGYLYAMQALYGCALPEAGDTPPAPERQDAIRRLRARCDFSEQEREDAEREFAAIRNLRISDDPLLEGMFGYLAAKGEAARMTILQTAIDTGNPWVIASVVQPAIAAQVYATLPGKADTLPDYVEYTLPLLACRLGADCGADAIATLRLCAERGWCAGTLPDALRAGLGADYVRIDALTAKALADVRTRNIARLARTSWATDQPSPSVLNNAR